MVFAPLANESTLHIDYKAIEPPSLKATRQTVPTANDQSTQRAFPFLHEFLGELVAMFVLITVGDATGAISYYYLGDMTFKVWLFIVFGWMLAVFLAVMGGLSFSRPYLNSVMILNAMILEGMPAVRGVCLMVAQLCGGFLSASLLTLIFASINHTTVLHNFFCTAKLASIQTTTMVIYEFLGTASLVLGSYILDACVGPQSEKRWSTAFRACLPLFPAGIVAYPLKTFGLNPARDLGPRLWWLIFEVTCSRGPGVWAVVMGQGYFWVPTLVPFGGGLLAARVLKARQAGSNADSTAKLV